MFIEIIGIGTGRARIEVTEVELKDLQVALAGLVRGRRRDHYGCVSVAVVDQNGRPVEKGGQDAA